MASIRTLRGSGEVGGFHRSVGHARTLTTPRQWMLLCGLSPSGPTGAVMRSPTAAPCTTDGQWRAHPESTGLGASPPSKAFAQSRE